MKKVISLIIIILLGLITTPALALTPTKIELMSGGEQTIGVSTAGEIGAAVGILFFGTEYNDSNGLDGRLINLQYHYVDKPWQTLGNITTESIEDSNGLFWKMHRPTQTTYYQAIFAGDSEYAGSASNTTRTIVKVKVSISGKKSRRYYKAYGGVAPRKAGRIVLIKVKRKGRNWKTVKKTRLNKYSKYSYKYYWKRKGTYFVKTEYPGDKYNGRNASPTKSFKVN